MKNWEQITHYNSTGYIKVQVPSTPPSVPSLPNPIPSESNPKSTSTAPVAGAAAGAVTGTLLIAVVAILYRRASTKEEEDEEEEDFPQLAVMPTRFSYIDLRTATNNFWKKLGGGGFGSVFDGTLADGTRVAVKQLESVNKGKTEFLREVETVGSIHHLHLVKLFGFCSAPKNHTGFLVYEHMINGSLDRWISGKENHELSWEILHKIIHQVSKGLAYLHEECRHKIAHLDIKSENILLDSNFNAKVSDFGLAKLIDRNQSVGMTVMRGTPGYLAPEWLTSLITEKVDVYSFGVVVTEIVWGRKNVDLSQPEELTQLLNQKGVAGRLLDGLE